MHKEANFSSKLKLYDISINLNPVQVHSLFNQSFGVRSCDAIPDLKIWRTRMYFAYVLHTIDGLLPRNNHPFTLSLPSVIPNSDIKSQ